MAPARWSAAGSKRMVHHDEIRKARGRRPFRPFVLHVADGRSFRVGHPELVFVTRHGCANDMARLDEVKAFIEENGGFS